MSASDALMSDMTVDAESSFQPRLARALLVSMNAALGGAAGCGSAPSLRVVRDALLGDEIEMALRHMDRAWRCFPEKAALLGPLYGHLLLVARRDDQAAARLLTHATAARADPDSAALAAYALWRLRSPDEARSRLASTLADFCVLADGLPYLIAGEVLPDLTKNAPGWVARGSHLELIGELWSDQPANVLDIRCNGNVVLTQILRTSPTEGRQPFSVALPDGYHHTALEVSCRGMPLIGSGRSVPEDFQLDGRARITHGRLNGWARIGWLPSRRVSLRIADETSAAAPLATGCLPDPGYRWRFDLDLRGARRHELMRIEAQLPDGRWRALPDSPVPRDSALCNSTRPRRLRKWGVAPGRRSSADRPIVCTTRTTVIIPVHDGGDTTLACIASVRATLDETASIVVVDDASQDRGLVESLDALAVAGGITLLRNAENLGFAASVNRALELMASDDVVLLNSDTRVAHDWLPRLRAAAYSGLKVGTVTALSNNATIASYPRTTGSTLDPERTAALHALAAAVHSDVRVEIPVGVGSCLYIRRDCLDDVGDLDAGAFGQGYGEETDFCLRARRRGWSHQLAADVFVYHAGAGSFAGRREALMERSERVLNIRHPGYDQFIASFLAQDPLLPLRRKLDERRLSDLRARVVLVVTSELTGGVERYVGERCRDLQAQGVVPLLLKPAETEGGRYCVLSTDALELPNLRYAIPAELDSLDGLLREIGLHAVEIQHFLHHDARVIERVRALPTPYDVFVHDYAWVCPRVTLIDGSGRYCGEPSIAACRICISTHGSYLGESLSVTALRARSATWLAGARQVVVPSNDTATRLQRYFPHVAVHVQPHSTLAWQAAPGPQSAPRQCVRVALVGAIGEHKGYKLLLECARDARTRRLPLEFVVIGYTENDAPLLKTHKVFITGRYSEIEVPHLLARERPDIAWFPSVWPETWCYTLDYALSAGLPVAAFDLGAVAERLRKSARAALLPLDADPESINDCLMKFAALLPPPALPDDPIPSPPARETFMNPQFDTKSTGAQLDEGLAASVQTLPLPAGLYLFSVRSSGLPPEAERGPFALPALHVGVGPGVPAEQVEFIAGPSTHGAWLFAETDLLVTKINGDGALLILTSVRAPGGDTLSIHVKRLQGAADGETAAAAAQPMDGGTAPRPNDASLPVRVVAHVRSRGDMVFDGEGWVGRVAPGLWLESFHIQPMDDVSAAAIEYKGLTGTGFETPWLSDANMCGTQGMACPLVGFAIRLKAGEAADYDCEYSGYFQSGVTVGPLRNGAPCRSTVANDPLEGIQLRLIQRSPALPAPAAAAAAAAAPAPTPAPAPRSLRPLWRSAPPAA